MGQGERANFEYPVATCHLPENLSVFSQQCNILTNVSICLCRSPFDVGFLTLSQSTELAAYRQIGTKGITDTIHGCLAI